MATGKKEISHRKIVQWTGVLLLIGICLTAFDHRAIVRTYVIDVPEIMNPMRIALVTDLHSCRYGDNQKELIDMIDGQHPDVILLGGDIFDDILPDENSEKFIAGVSDRYPCYYVTGNHEWWSGQDRFLEQMGILKRYNVRILSGTYESVEIAGNLINICGVDDPDSSVKASWREAYASGIEQTGSSLFADQLESVSKAVLNDQYTILLSHRPEFIEKYAEYGFDLVVCGHAHGGQWRIPLLVNGVYAPNQGLFPEYAGGQYKKADTTMIVSRGLSRESTRLPRIFNRPELVMIHLF